MLEREGDRYANTRETELFLDRAKPSYVGGLLELGSARGYPLWGALTEGLRTGRPQNEIKDEANAFAELYADPNRLKSFVRGMTSASLGPATALAHAFPWSQYRTLADVGTAEGVLPVQVARANPNLTGIGFDLPPVRPLFEEFVAAHGLSERVRFEGGDFFVDPMPKADVLVMGHILHGFDLATKQTLVRKAYEALPDGGALIVYDSIIDDERRHNVFGLLMSLNMLLESSGGFDYTGAECQQWLREAGFRETRQQHLAGPTSMVVGMK